MIKKLILSKYNISNSIDIRGNKKIDYIIDLLSLVSCSGPEDIKTQLKVYSKFYNYNDEIWEHDKILGISPCNPEYDNTNFNGIIRRKGKYNYDLAYLLNFVNNTFLNKKYVGYLIKYNKNPYFWKGSISEELILFDNLIIERDLSDPFDFMNYKSNLTFKINMDFKMPLMLRGQNINFYLNRLYNLNYISNKKFINSGNIIFIDCNKFKGLNLNDSVDYIKTDIKNFISFMGDNIYILVNSDLNFNVLGFKQKKYNEFQILYKNKLPEDKIHALKYINISPGKDTSKKDLNSFIKHSTIIYDKTIKSLEKIKQEKVIIINSDISNKNPVVNYMKNFGYNLDKKRNNANYDCRFIFFKENTKITILKYGKLFFIPILIEFF